MKGVQIFATCCSHTLHVRTFVFVCCSTVPTRPGKLFQIIVFSACPVNNSRAVLALVETEVVCPLLKVLVTGRESLAEIERRLLAAEAAAQQAKDAVVGQADVAKLERERALAARAEAEQANKNLDSARYSYL